MVDIPGWPTDCLRRAELLILCADGRFADQGKVGGDGLAVEGASVGVGDWGGDGSGPVGCATAWSSLCAAVTRSMLASIRGRASGQEVQ